MLRRPILVVSLVVLLLPAAVTAQTGSTPTPTEAAARISNAELMKYGVTGGFAIAAQTQLSHRELGGRKAGVRVEPAVIGYVQINPASMLVHDTRLAGTAPSIAPNTFRINEKNRVRHVFGWISQYARSSGGLSRLLIMCHGFESGVHDTIERISTSDMGFGLQFGKETLTLANVAEASVLKGLVQTIIVYACGPARTRRGFAGTAADGRRFCSEFAAYADAELFAPSDTQYYSMNPPNDLLRRIFAIGPQDIIDFGPWEGTLSRFSPDGTVTQVSNL